MNRLINYLKFIGIFLAIELAITFVMSLFNLLGASGEITSLIIFILNIILFFALSFINAKKKQKRGYLEGLFIGLIFILLMYLIKLIIVNNSFNIATIIYYIILLLSSILGGMFGINKKSDTK